MSERTIITISRQYGSGGRKIGQLLAETMGIPFYDNEIITMAAKDSGIHETYFKEAETMARSSINLSLSILSPSTERYGMPLNEKIYMTQSKVITDLAEKGPCVIVGRCADYVLENNHAVVNIFIHSSMANRIKRATSEYNLPKEGAETFIRKVDKSRANYYSYFTNKTWGRAENYHLVINSDFIGIDNSVKMIESFVKLREEYTPGQY